MTPQLTPAEQEAYRQFPEEMANELITLRSYDLNENQRNIFLSAVKWSEESRWLAYPENKPELINGRAHKRLVIAGKNHEVAVYFPSRFKSFEPEDWDDEDPEWYDNDTDKGCAWLYEGWYREYEHRGEYFWDKLENVTAFMPLPPSPSKHS